MKKLPFSIWHIFYWVAIVTLGYLYYSARFGAYQEMNHNETISVFRDAEKLLQLDVREAENILGKNVRDNGDSLKYKYIDISVDYEENNRKFRDYIENITVEFFHKSCHIPDATEKFSYKVDEFRYLKNNYFNDKKIAEIKQAFSTFEKAKLLIIKDIDSIELDRRHFHIDPIVNDSTFWDRIKSGSAANAFQKLEELKLKVDIDNSEAMNYFLEINNTYCHTCENPRMELMSKQINVNNREYLEANVKVVVSPSHCKVRNTEIFANGKKLKIGTEGAYLKYMPTRKGKNTIHLKCVVTNPLTKESTSFRDDRYFYAY